MRSEAHALSSRERPVPLVRALLGQPTTATQQNIHAPSRPPTVMQTSVSPLQPGGEMAVESSMPTDWVEAELMADARGAAPLQAAQPSGDAHPALDTSATPGASRQDKAQSSRQPAAPQVPPTASTGSSLSSREEAGLTMSSVSIESRQTAGPSEDAQAALPSSVTPVDRERGDSGSSTPLVEPVRLEEPTGSSHSARSNTPGSNQPAAIEPTLIDIPGQTTMPRKERESTEQPGKSRFAPDARPLVPYAEPPAESTTELAMPLSAETKREESGAPSLPETVSPGTGSPETGSPGVSLPNQPQDESSTISPSASKQNHHVASLSSRQPHPGNEDAYSNQSVQSAAQSAGWSNHSAWDSNTSHGESTDQRLISPPVPASSQNRQRENSLSSRPRADSGNIGSNRYIQPAAQSAEWPNQSALVSEPGHGESAVVRDLRKQVDELSARVASHEKRQQQPPNPVPPQPVVVLNRVDQTQRSPRAFWARSYRGRAYLRTGR